MPKNESLVWQYFNKVPVSANGPKYKCGTCKFCDQNYISNAKRMAKHLGEKCLKCPINVKKIFSQAGADLVLDELDEEGNILTANSTTSTESSSFSNHQVSKRATKTRNLASFVHTMDEETKAALDADFARAIFSSAVALSLTENEHWKKFFHHLRLAWVPPSRFELSNTLLETEYQTVQSSALDKINKADSLTMMSDGWTDINGNSLINIIIATPEPVFYSALETTVHSHTGAYISHVLGAAIAEIGSDKIHAVVTDNASNMKLAWKMLQESFPHLIIYGCFAHGTNLLIKDIVTIPTIHEILMDAKSVIKFFRNHQVPMQILKKIQLENGSQEMALLLPVDTRWGSQCTAIDSLLRTKEHLQMAVMHKDVSSKIGAAMKRKILDDDNFWRILVNVRALIEPASSLIKTIEGDRPNLSYFATSIKSIFTGMEKNLLFLTAEEEDRLTKIFAKRKEFLFHPIQLAVHMLNPNLDNLLLSEAEQQQAIDTITMQAKLLNLDSDKVIVDLGEFLGKSSIWTSDAVWAAAKNMTPVAWWKGFCARRELTKLAVIILNLPTTAAACERNWSTYANIKTVKRNRLTQDRTKKLVAIKFNLDLLKKKAVGSATRSHGKLDQMEEDGNEIELEDEEIFDEFDFVQGHDIEESVDLDKTLDIREVFDIGDEFYVNEAAYVGEELNVQEAEHLGQEVCVQQAIEVGEELYVEQKQQDGEEWLDLNLLRENE